MKAMLVCAEESDGQRYVASAIVACSKCPEVVETLVALGTTWLTHFLFVCQFFGLAMNRNKLILSLVRATGSHDKQPNKEPSELATPTLDETASHLGKGVGHRRGSFREDVRRKILCSKDYFVDPPIIKLLKRDGHKCVLTGFKGTSHPALDGSDPLVYLQASHILRRSIGNFEKDHTSASVGHLSI